MTGTTEIKGNTITITRILNAPRERVWQMWTVPEHAQKWWGPKDFTCPIAKIDARQGGKILLAMHGPAGSEWDKDMFSGGEFLEVVPMEKLVMTDNFMDSEGNKISPEEMGMPAGDWADEMVVTVTFEDAEEGKTKMTITHEGHAAGEMSEMASVGWNESLDKMAASLAG